MDFRLDILHCTGFDHIASRIDDLLDIYGDLLPSDKTAAILIKPNLNSNMNALTGNTTDLRILSAVILGLKKRGYTRITIGEGTNSGFYRNNISVISRLGVDRLARHHGVKIKDLNQSRGCEIAFDRGQKACVAREVFEADMLINLPKMKTHFEAGMTGCLKNLMGCLVGQENKKKAHDNLAENILFLNDAVCPHLHIMDALVAMEGLGPTKGVPIRMDRLIAGTDPYLIDLLCAHMAGFDYRIIPTLDLARKKGRITRAHFDFIDTLDLLNCRKKFAPPRAGALARFIHSPKRQKLFLKIRNTPFFSYLAGTDWFGKLLYLTDLRQDVFCSEEMRFKGLLLNRDRCDHCGLCRELCPLGVYFPEKQNDPDSPCLECLYCYSVCPRQAIEFQGDMGFFKEQVKQYEKKIRKIYKE